MPHQDKTTVGGRELIVETGELAGQANGSVLVTYGETVVLVTAVASEAPREGIDFFPLTVDVEEKLYAAGKIPGGFPKREGRPPERSILASRLTDRPIRPLFPKGFRHDVQVVATVLSADQENDPDVLAICGASAALCISDIPFRGPVASVRVGYVDGEYFINPTETQLLSSRLDLVVAGTRDAVMMVEAGARGLPEDVMLEAVRRGHEALQPILDLQERLVAAVGKPKRQFALATPPEDLEPALHQFMGGRLRSAVLNADKTARRDAIAELRHAAIEALAGGETSAHTAKEVGEAFDSALKALTRSMILDEGIRPDGRDTRTIRPISCKVGLLPRTHGSGLFTRGQTQVLSTETLGPGTDEQIIDDISAVERKRFLHHYNFPPFSTGEAKPLRGPGRREIGHGALAERALLRMIPEQEKFPYTIRVVSETLESNGSSSMATVCGGSLSLMDAGVPINAPVAGIAMGLIKEGDDYIVLTDIAGVEDHLGDMDFKVAGTADGITALQMDIKISGVTFDVLRDALEQARRGRLFILEKMRETIPGPREKLSPYAPRIEQIKIDPDKIGALIGKGGETIRALSEEFEADINVEDDGTVQVYAPSGALVDACIARIEAMTKEAEVGDRFTGKVVKTPAFGAFVELTKGTDGLLHISNVKPGERVSSVEEVLKQGDELDVTVVEVDRERGRIGLRLSDDPDVEGKSAEELAGVGTGDPGPPRGGR